MRGKMAKGLREMKPICRKQSEGRESHEETRNGAQCFLR